MAIYYDKKRGTYYISVYVELSNGDRKRVMRRGFKTQAEARKTEAEIIFNASVEDPDNPLFSEVADEYLKWYERRRKKSSYRKIKSIVDVNINPRFEEKRIQDIRNRDITSFQNDLIDKYAVSHAKKIHQVLSTIINYAIKQEYATINPAAIVGNTDLKETRHVNYWTLEVFKQFIEVVDDDMYYALFMVLYYSGLRKGELLALIWDDIDFDNNTINIDKTVSKTDVTTPKTPASIRKLSMPKYVMTLLNNLKIKNDPKIDYVVFGSFYDNIAESTLDRRYSHYIKLSKVKRIRLHDFRHSHASYLINKGAIASVVAKRLGHSDVATTLNTYSHLYPSTEKELIDKMENDFVTADIIKLVR